MKKLIAILTAAALCTGIAAAQSTYEAYLSGLNESSPNASPGTGYGTVVLNAAQTQITVDLTFSGLVAAATAGHIHGPAAPGVNAGVLFALSGVAGGTSGTIPQQVFAITPTQVGYLQSGLLYFNVHTSPFPGGEIRGQIQLVPEPSSAALLALGASLAGCAVRRKRA